MEKQEVMWFEQYISLGHQLCARLANTISTEPLDRITVEIPLPKATETAHKLLQGKLRTQSIV